ncbi:MAG: tetratricopeptide repeat protein [Prevotella sp.]|nr:tetratricopeptide repeat protein [Candidatus Equicola faecalis]MDO4819115.1 tetratricopeptide repeat protein [Prevotella sp.]
MAQNNQNQATQKDEMLNKSEVFVVKYKNTLLYSLIGILAIVAVILAVKNFYLAPRAEKASTELAKCQALFDQEDFEKSLKGDGKTCMGFIKVADEYGCTDAGNLAQLYAGLAYAQLGKYKEAEPYLEDFNTADDQMISPAALLALGDVYAQNGKLDDAVSMFKKAAEKAANNSISPTALIKAGEILESQNKKSDALKLYQEIKEKYVNSMVYQEIDKYIERVTE